MAHIRYKCAAAATAVCLSGTACTTIFLLRKCAQELMLL